MSWAGRRQGLYIGTSAIIFLALVSFVGIKIFVHPASCFNNVQDGTETGVDCGGACSRMCMNSVHPATVLWTRFLPLAPSTYTVAAYLENQNVGSYVKEARYTFKFFDDKNVLIAERQGTTVIAPTRITPVVETNINTGSRAPVKAFFEFLDEPLWDKAVDTPQIRVDGQDLDPSGQRLSVMVHNDGVKDASDIPVGAVLFDANGQAQAASMSVVPSIARNSSVPVVFTWPMAPAQPIVRAEVTALPTPQ